MKPALHRSVWFWLGCFVLVFLMWVWADSRRTRTNVTRTLMVHYPDGSGVGMQEEARIDSGVVILRWSGVTFTDPALKRVYDPVRYARGAANLGGGWFWKPWIARYPGAARGVTMRKYQADVPVWVVVLLYVMMCGGVVAWRRRRWRQGGNIEHRTPNIE